MSFFNIFSIYLFKTHIRILFKFVLVFILIFLITSTLDFLHKVRDIKLSTNLIIKLILYKIPYLIQESSSLIYYISSIVFYDGLSRRRELIALKTCGLSIWRIVAPSIIIACIFGLIMILLVNPLTTILLNINENIEARYIKKQKAITFLANNKLLIKENINDKQQYIFAQSLNAENHQLNNLTILLIGYDQRLITRIDAEYGFFKQNSLELHKLNIINFSKAVTGQKLAHHDYSLQKLNSISLDSKLSIKAISNNLAIPEIISFWQLPAHIKQLKEFGFSYKTYKNYYAKLLLKPIYMLVFGMLAICFININPRNNLNFKLLTSACLFGLCLQFFIELLFNVMVNIGLSATISYISILMIILHCSLYKILTSLEKV